MAHDHPEPGRLLWTGRAGASGWRVSFAAPIADEPTADASQKRRPTLWEITFESESGETFVRTWSPEGRILFGTLSGWSKGEIGSLKRALIAWKPSRGTDA